MRTRIVMLLAIAASLLLFPPAASAVLIWDTGYGDGATITDSDGQWDSYTASWNDGVGSVVWNSSQVAQFGTADSPLDSGGFVTLGENVAATGLQFQRSHTVTPYFSGSGESLTLSGAAPEIVFPAGTPNKTTAVISTTLTVTDGVPGTADHLIIRGPNATPATSYPKLDLNVPDGASVTYSGEMRISDGAIVTLYGTHNLSPTGTGVVVNPGSTLRLWIAGDYGAGQTIYLTGYGFGTADSLHDSRAAFMLAGPNGQISPCNWLGDVVLSGDSSIAPARQDATISGVISGAGKLVKTSDKALILTNSNTYTGDTEVRRGGLNLNSTVGPAIHKDGGNLVFLANLSNEAGIINIQQEEQIGDGAEIQFLYTGTAAGLQTINLLGHTETVKGLAKSTETSESAYVQNESAGLSGKLVLDTAGADFSFNGVIQDGSVADMGTLALTKKGLGSQTLAGVNTYTGPTVVETGTLAVTGSITSTVEVQSAGTLRGTGTITGDVDLNGTLGVAYNGETDTVDLLTVTGLLDLTVGTISLNNAGTGGLDKGTYVLAAYGSLLGNPAVELGLQSGWLLDYQYDYNGGVDNSIALLVTTDPPSIPGDTDGDGDVDADDAGVVASHWGQTNQSGGAGIGDFNGDLAVNAADASILAANWTGSTGGLGEGTGVPEPSMLALLAAGVGGLLLRRRP